MTSWAAHARVEHAPVAPSRAPRPRPQTRPRTKQAPQSRVASGVAWITVFGILLAGVIAINVAGLQQRMKLNQLTKERAALLSQIPDQKAKLSARLSSARVGVEARRRGEVLAPSADTSIVPLPRTAK
jgi:hypothetical protein